MSSALAQLKSAEGAAVPGSAAGKGAARTQTMATVPHSVAGLAAQQRASTGGVTPAGGGSSLKSGGCDPAHANGHMYSTLTDISPDSTLSSGPGTAGAAMAHPHPASSEWEVQGAAGSACAPSRAASSSASMKQGGLTPRDLTARRRSSLPNVMAGLSRSSLPTVPSSDGGTDGRRVSAQGAAPRAPSQPQVPLPPVESAACSPVHTPTRLAQAVGVVGPMPPAAGPIPKSASAVDDRRAGVRLAGPQSRTSAPLVPASADSAASMPAAAASAQPASPAAAPDKATSTSWSALSIKTLFNRKPKRTDSNLSAAAKSDLSGKLPSLNGRAAH